MTDSNSPPPAPPEKPKSAPAPATADSAAAPRRIPRDKAPRPEPEGRDRTHVSQRVMEQRPHERKPTEHAAARGKRPDLRDLPPPRRDTPSNVWRADPPPAPPRARENDRPERRDGPRRAFGDAPRVDRPGERRASTGAHNQQGARVDFRESRPADLEAPRAPFRKDDRRATGFPPGPRRDDRGPQGRGPQGGDRGGAPLGERGRAPSGARDSTDPQGPNDRPRYNGPRDDGRGEQGTPPPRRRDDQPGERQARQQAAPPPRPTFDPNAPRREDQRLSKVLAERGLASRREADDWIDAGWVKVDGEMAVLGARVFPHQVIEIDDAARTQQAHRVTILLHKPIGYVSGQAEDGYEPASVLVTQANHWPEDPSRERWHPGHARGIAPAGRLDIDSTGMLVLTQDGRIARHLIGEDSDVEKEYLVRVEYPAGGQFPDNDLDRLRHGLWLDGKELRPAKVSWANEDQLRFVLREGRKRQIRRMCEAVGLVVTGLKRVRIGSVVLGKLPQGQWRYLREDERF